jgi:long-chain fatty acid transport protein
MGRPQPFTQRAITCLAAGLSFFIACSEAGATNGLNLIGFGAESYMMGGTDIAVARDTTAMNSNPAGLTQIDDRRVDIYGSIAVPGLFRHQDEYGNHNRQVGPALIGDLGYARKLTGTPFHAGIGLFAQGGSGVNYGTLNTAFGTRDELSILFRIARLTPTLAWQVDDRLALGLTGVVVYSDMQQDFFPNTSFFNAADPSRSFFGSKIRKMKTVETGWRLGLMYRLSDRVRLGLAYNSEVEIRLEDGELISDQSAAGLGKVRYDDVVASGIDQPQELGTGIAWDVTDRLLIAAEINWLDWSSAVNKSRLQASDPNNPAAPALDLVGDLDWRDQYVLSLGLAYERNRSIWRAGFNYGRNPVPRANMHPLLSPVARYHLALGAGRRLDNEWRVDGGIAYQFKEETTYTNSALPFGTDTQQEIETLSFHLQFSRIW